VFALVILLSLKYVFLQTNSTEQGDYGKLIVFQGLRKFLPFMVLENLLLSSQDLFTEPYSEPF
jgi:tellurite resistance-related uncharacterized protein